MSGREMTLSALRPTQTGLIAASLYSAGGRRN
jgi:hypothetical protein